MYHFKRIGPQRTRPESANLMCFKDTITVIGRKKEQVDYVICSSHQVQNSFISRRHARVIRNSAGRHILFDDSRNGVYINDIKIDGNQTLYEGDTITFGHHNGEKLNVSDRVRQPDSEFQFICTRCECGHSNIPPCVKSEQENSSCASCQGVKSEIKDEDKSGGHVVKSERFVSHNICKEPQLSSDTSQKEDANKETTSGHVNQPSHIVQETGIDISKILNIENSTENTMDGSINLNADKKDIGVDTEGKGDEISGDVTPVASDTLTRESTETSAKQQKEAERGVFVNLEQANSMLKRSDIREECKKNEYEKNYAQNLTLLETKDGNLPENQTTAIAILSAKPNHGHFVSNEANINGQQNPHLDGSNKADLLQCNKSHKKSDIQIEKSNTADKNYNVLVTPFVAGFNEIKEPHMTCNDVQTEQNHLTSGTNTVIPTVQTNRVSNISDVQTGTILTENPQKIACNVQTGKLHIACDNVTDIQIEQPHMDCNNEAGLHAQPSAASDKTDIQIYKGVDMVRDDKVEIQIKEPSIVLNNNKADIPKETKMTNDQSPREQSIMIIDKIDDQAKINMAGDYKDEMTNDDEVEIQVEHPNAAVDNKTDLVDDAHMTDIIQNQIACDITHISTDIQTEQPNIINDQVDKQIKEMKMDENTTDHEIEDQKAGKDEDYQTTLNEMICENKLNNADMETEEQQMTRVETCTKHQLDIELNFQIEDSKMMCDHDQNSAVDTEKNKISDEEDDNKGQNNVETPTFGLNRVANKTEKHQTIDDKIQTEQLQSDADKKGHEQIDELIARTDTKLEIFLPEAKVTSDNKDNIIEELNLAIQNRTNSQTEQMTDCEIQREQLVAASHSADYTVDIPNKELNTIADNKAVLHIEEPKRTGKKQYIEIDKTKLVGQIADSLLTHDIETEDTNIVNISKAHRNTEPHSLCDNKVDIQTKQYDDGDNFQKEQYNMDVYNKTDVQTEQPNLAGENADIETEPNRTSDDEQDSPPDEPSMTLMNMMNKAGIHMVKLDTSVSKVVTEIEDVIEIETPKISWDCINELELEETELFDDKTGIEQIAYSSDSKNKVVRGKEEPHLTTAEQPNVFIDNDTVDIQTEPVQPNEDGNNFQKEQSNMDDHKTAVQTEQPNLAGENDNETEPNIITYDNPESPPEEPSVTLVSKAGIHMFKPNPVICKAVKETEAIIESDTPTIPGDCKHELEKIEERQLFDVETRISIKGKVAWPEKTFVDESKEVAVNQQKELPITAIENGNEVCDKILAWESFQNTNDEHDATDGRVNVEHDARVNVEIAKHNSITNALPEIDPCSNKPCLNLQKMHVDIEKITNVDETSSVKPPEIMSMENLTDKRTKVYTDKEIDVKPSEMHKGTTEQCEEHLSFTSILTDSSDHEDNPENNKIKLSPVVQNESKSIEMSEDFSFDTQDGVTEGSIESVENDQYSLSLDITQTKIENAFAVTEGSIKSVGNVQYSLSLDITQTNIENASAVTEGSIESVGNDPHSLSLDITQTNIENASDVTEGSIESVGNDQHSLSLDITQTNIENASTITEGSIESMGNDQDSLSLDITQTNIENASASNEESSNSKETVRNILKCSPGNEKIPAHNQVLNVSESTETIDITISEESNYIESEESEKVKVSESTETIDITTSQESIKTKEKNAKARSLFVDPLCTSSPARPMLADSDQACQSSPILGLDTAKKNATDATNGHTGVIESKTDVIMSDTLEFKDDSNSVLIEQKEDIVKELHLTTEKCNNGALDFSETDFTCTDNSKMTNDPVVGNTNKDSAFECLIKDNRNTKHATPVAKASDSKCRQGAKRKRESSNEKETNDLDERANKLRKILRDFLENDTNSNNKKMNEPCEVKVNDETALPLQCHFKQYEVKQRERKIREMLRQYLNELSEGIEHDYLAFCQIPDLRINFHSENISSTESNLMPSCDNNTMKGDVPINNLDFNLKLIAIADQPGCEKSVQDGNKHDSTVDDCLLLSQTLESSLETELNLASTDQEETPQSNFMLSQSDSLCLFLESSDDHEVHSDAVKTSSQSMQNHIPIKVDLEMQNSMELTSEKFHGELNSTDCDEITQKDIKESVELGSSQDEGAKRNDCSITMEDAEKVELSEDSFENVGKSEHNLSGHNTTEDSKSLSPVFYSSIAGSSHNNQRQPSGERSRTFEETRQTVDDIVHDVINKASKGDDFQGNINKIQDTWKIKNSNRNSEDVLYTVELNKVEVNCSTKRKNVTVSENKSEPNKLDKLKVTQKISANNAKTTDVIGGYLLNADTVQDVQCAYNDTDVLETSHSFHCDAKVEENIKFHISQRIECDAEEPNKSVFKTSTSIDCKAQDKNETSQKPEQSDAELQDERETKTFESSYCNLEASQNLNCDAEVQYKNEAGTPQSIYCDAGVVNKNKTYQKCDQTDADSLRNLHCNTKKDEGNIESSETLNFNAVRQGKSDTKILQTLNCNLETAQSFPCDSNIQDKNETESSQKPGQSDAEALQNTHCDAEQDKGNIESLETLHFDAELQEKNDVNNLQSLNCNVETSQNIHSDLKVHNTIDIGTLQKTDQNDTETSRNLNCDDEGDKDDTESLESLHCDTDIHMTSDINTSQILQSDVEIKDPNNRKTLENKSNVELPEKAPLHHPEGNTGIQVNDTFVNSSSQEECSGESTDVLGMNKLLRSSSPEFSPEDNELDLSIHSEEAYSECSISQNNGHSEDTETRTGNSQYEEDNVNDSNSQYEEDNVNDSNSPEIPSLSSNCAKGYKRFFPTDDVDLEMSQEIPVYVTKTKELTSLQNTKVSCNFDSDSDLEFQAPEIDLEHIKYVDTADEIKESEECDNEESKSMSKSLQECPDSMPDIFCDDAYQYDGERVDNITCDAGHHGSSAELIESENNLKNVKHNHISSDNEESDVKNEDDLSDGEADECSENFDVQDIDLNNSMDNEQNNKLNNSMDNDLNNSIDSELNNSMDNELNNSMDNELNNSIDNKLSNSIDKETDQKFDTSKEKISDMNVDVVEGNGNTKSSINSKVSHPSSVLTANCEYVLSDDEDHQSNESVEVDSVDHFADTQQVCEESQYGMSMKRKYSECSEISEHSDISGIAAMSTDCEDNSTLASSLSQGSTEFEQNSSVLDSAVRSKSSRSCLPSGKLGSVLERIRKKRRLRKSAESRSPTRSDRSVTSSQESTDNTSKIRALPADDCGMDVSSTEKQIAKACRILDNLDSFMRYNIAERNVALGDHPRVKAWVNELEILKTKKDLPKTVIAVVGDTGSGKSSLMNALLDHSDILPTSCMRACTAVVVEITANKDDNLCRAEIDFLDEKEWTDELILLLTELKGPDGEVRARQPDLQSEAGVAWSKIRAVYGQFRDGVTLHQLTSNKTVTHCLGKTKKICRENPKDFTKSVNHYIQSRDSIDGGEFWPIVKHVRISLPNCDVCKSGAVLVDLPGIRDSNAARDKIARDFLKDCTAVWVVALIHRAVDDKTAKDLLGENFRRQLLMDGQYGSVSFVCTKTDQISVSETLREKPGNWAVDLVGKVEPIETTKVELLNKVQETKFELKSLGKELKSLDKKINFSENEKKDFASDIAEVEAVIQGASPEDFATAEEQLKELRAVLEDKTIEAREFKQKQRELRPKKRSHEKAVLEFEKQICEMQRQVSSLCAAARNEYVKKQIRRDFRAGLKEMKRQAGLVEDEDEDIIYSGDDSDDEDFSLTVENLKVFCVSSNEYLKLKGKLPQDGPTQTFNNVADTGIPHLHSFVHELTRVRKLQGSERLLRCIGQCVSDMYSYLIDEGTVDHMTRDDVYKVFVRHLSAVKSSGLTTIIDTVSKEMDTLFNKSLRERSDEGAITAADRANQICNKWSSKQNKSKPQEGGLHFSTFKATVNRDGVYKSKTFGTIDFNQDLCSPMYTSLMITWDMVFNKKMKQILEGCKAKILAAMKRFAVNIRQDFMLIDVSHERIDRVYVQHLSSASTKLRDTINGLMDYITERQREINRVLTPAVQQNMQVAYQLCSAEKGPGTFNRMKAHLSEHVNSNKDFMFDEASNHLLEQLLQLHAEVLGKVNQVGESLLKDLTTLYEPLWEAPVNTKVLRAALLPEITQCQYTINKLLKEANIELEAKSEDELFASQQSKEILQSVSRSNDLQFPRKMQRVGSASHFSGSHYTRPVVKKEVSISQQKVPGTCLVYDRKPNVCAAYGSQRVLDEANKKSSKALKNTPAEEKLCVVRPIMSETKPRSIKHEPTDFGVPDDAHIAAEHPGCSFPDAHSSPQCESNLRRTPSKLSTKKKATTIAAEHPECSFPDAHSSPQCESNLRRTPSKLSTKKKATTERPTGSSWNVQVETMVQKTAKNVAKNLALLKNTAARAVANVGSQGALFDRTNRTVASSSSVKKEPKSPVGKRKKRHTSSALIDLTESSDDELPPLKKFMR